MIYTFAFLFSLLSLNIWLGIHGNPTLYIRDAVFVRLDFLVFVFVSFLFGVVLAYTGGTVRR